MQYTNQDHVEAYLQRELKDKEVEYLDTLINAASVYINDYTGREWSDIESGSTSGVYMYDGSGSRELFIDDYTTITKVELLDALGGLFQEIPATDYVLYPQNEEYTNSIYLRYGSFPRGRASIRITGTKTTGEPPSEIAHVATVLVSNSLTSSLESGEMRKESIEGYSYEKVLAKDTSSELQEVLHVLDGWRKISF